MRSSGAHLIMLATAVAAACAEREPATSPAEAAVSARGATRSTSAGITVTQLNPGGRYAAATSLNDAGQVVGWTGSATMAFGLYTSAWFWPVTGADWRAFECDSGTGRCNSLGLLPGTVMAKAQGINHAGYVVGQSGERPVAWSPGSSEAVPLAAPGDSGFAMAINDNNLAVGRLSTGAGRWRAVQWQLSGASVGGPVNIGQPDGYGELWVYGVNRSGQTVGEAIRPGDPSNRPLLWTLVGGQWHEENLGVFPGDVGGLAMGVNDLGDVVGVSIPATGCSHAMVWLTDRTSGTVQRQFDLPSLGGCGATAYAINNQRQVVGQSKTRNQASSPTLWSFTVGSNGNIVVTAPVNLNPAGAKGVAGVALTPKDPSTGLLRIAGFGGSIVQPVAQVWTVK